MLCLTLYSHFNVITYEIKFVSPINGYSFQSIIESENARVYPPVIPAKYQIPGSGLNWYTDSEFTNLYTFDLMPKNGITLYGKWEVDTGVGIWGDYNFQSANSTIDSEKEFVLYLDYVTYNYVTEDKSIVKDITFATKSEIEQNMGKYVALTEYFGTFPVNYSISEGQKSGVKSTIRVFVDADVMQKEGSLTTERNDYTPYYYPDYHYTGRENHSTFYVDGLLYSQNVESSNQLVYALEHGFKPVCKNGSSAEAVYQKARETLNSIIEENFTDYQKALAIFEYLALNVQYDNNAVTITNSGDKREWGKYDAFYLEGVFNNQKAVCDGISKAFSVMCNIEGIPCVQVTGNGHAWCKVKINNRWTIVDPTHGNTLIEANKRGVLAHEHLMMTEDAKKSIGYSSELYSNIVADYSVNYFELKTFSTLIGASNFVANGKEDIVLILNYYRQLFNSGSFLIDFCYTGNNFEKDLRDAITIVGYSGNIRSSTFNSVYGKIVKLLF